MILRLSVEVHPRFAPWPPVTTTAPTLSVSQSRSEDEERIRQSWSSSPSCISTAVIQIWLYSGYAVIQPYVYRIYSSMDLKLGGC